jgi:hypothetical protein
MAMTTSFYMLYNSLFIESCDAIWYAQIRVLLNKLQIQQIQSGSHVEACQNTSTIALQVVKGDEKGTGCLGYNWRT